MCMIFTMFIFAQKYNKHNSKTVLNICCLSIIISFILLLFSINMTTIILYNLVYYTFVEMVVSISDIRLFDYSNKQPFSEELNSEYFIFRELFLNLGRILGYIILLIIGLMRNLEYLKILFLFSTIALITVIHLSKNMNIEENKYSID